MPVVPGTADPGQHAHPFDPNIALLLHLRVDHRVDRRPARPAVLPAWFPDMPQGCAKKIQVQLLLADFPLQRADPPLRRRRRILGTRCHGRFQCGWREQRAADLLQGVGSVRTILPAPAVQEFPPHPQLAASAVTSSAASISDIARSLNARVQRVFF